MTGVRPIVLALLDGWGVRAEREGNAIALARTPIYDRLAATSPRTVLDASGQAAGLAPGKPGHAQAAYATLGAGRPVESPLTGINRVFADHGPGGIASHPMLKQIVSRVRPLGGAVHLIGAMTPSGIAGHQNHLAVLAALLSHEGVKVWVHGVMDGIDTDPQGGIEHLSEFLDDISGAEHAELASVFGRSHGFDELPDPAATAKLWRALVEADAPYTEYPTAYLDECYRKGLNDDKVPPALVSSFRGIRPDDALLLVNLQPDHGQALLGALMDPVAARLSQKPMPLSGVYSLVRLTPPLGARVEPLFEGIGFRASLAESLSRAGLKQLALTESVTEANLWTFARGGATSLFPGENVLVTDTPPLAQSEKRPELAAAALASELLAALKAREHDLIVANFCNAAIVGRSGNLRATIGAVETIDKYLGKIAAQIDKRGGTLILCGTYGKAERMSDPETGAPFRRTTASPVPFIMAGGAQGALPAGGTLADAAPTILDLLGLAAPGEMTGMSLMAERADRVSA